MKKWMKIYMYVMAACMCIAFSVIGLLGMLCNYQSAAGLPWALLAGVTFMGATYCSIELGELWNAKTK